VAGGCSTASGYKLSGKVSHSTNGTAVPGVTLTLWRSDNGCGQRATTASNGNYQFIKLPSATYTVTPSKAGCTSFAPASRTVAIAGGNRGGQNFTATCP
jgi:hypothetical protein